MTTGTRTPGTLVISLDFELHWGVHDKLELERYRDNLLGVRCVVPSLLELFAGEGIHATWATVGLLFFESKRELLANLPERRPCYRQRALSAYSILDTVGSDEQEDPFHFAPSLIRRIADTPGQEIGTHTFSHFYCLEPGQDAGDFREDLRAAVRVMRAKTGRSPESIVFPRNQCNPDYLAVCRELGILAYRGNPEHWTQRPRPAGEIVGGKGSQAWSSLVVFICAQMDAAAMRARIDRTNDGTRGNAYRWPLQMTSARPIGPLYDEATPDFCTKEGRMAGRKAGYCAPRRPRSIEFVRPLALAVKDRQHLDGFIAHAVRHDE